MIEELEGSKDDRLGFAVSGAVDKSDYDLLTPAVQRAVDRFGSVRLVLDLRGFHWEKVEAWGADLRFGKTFHAKIERMAIVGDASWEKLLAKLAAPFYAREARYFTTREAAWAWIRETAGAPAGAS